MKRAGILKSARGRIGGYSLAASPHKITARDVVLAIEGEILGLVCFRQKGRRNRCIHLSDCQIRDFWNGLRDNMEGFLKDHSLERLLQLRKKGSK